jgi:uncharacterized GH25 family protein
MKAAFSAGLLLSAALSLNASAHEFWMEPANFFPKPKESTAIHLYVGDGLRKDREERPYQTGKTVMFKTYTARVVEDLKPVAKERAQPIYAIAPAAPGQLLLAMERNWSFVKLEPQRFEDYLRGEGLDYIVAERAKLNESNKQGTERYSRFIKSLMLVGGKLDGTYATVVGSKLEIVPLENPYAKKVGDTLPLRVLFDGKPLSGHAVFADNTNATVQKVVTDKEGRVNVLIDRNGMWIVRLVLMRRCDANCGEADWESFWGAFTFGVK